jgi:Cu(I)/Ag(I) efflux system membrane fusion protein
MSRRTLIIIGSAVIVVGVVIAFAVMQGGVPTKASAPVTASAPAQTGHQGHGGAPAQQSQPQPQQAAVPEPAQEEPAAVEIPPEKQQLIGVRIVEAKVQPLRKVIRTVGIVEYDERRLATVNTKFEGWIEKLHVDYTGKYVRKGDPLAEIYSPELLATQQEYINLLKWEKENISAKDTTVRSMLAKDSRSIVEGARQRLRLWDISDSQIDKIEKTGKPVRTLTIHSPVNGYVVQKMAIQGMRVMPGEKLFDIADLSTVWVLSDIFEYELPLIKTGQKAMISLSYFPGKEFPSTIEYVYPSITGQTRSAKVRFTIPNPGGKLKPQMYTNVEVKIDLGNKLLIPEDAMLDAGKRQVVYVDKGDGYFEPREVTPGMRTEGMIEIIKGLKPGERVAGSAAFLIDSEAKLKGIVK